FVPKEDLLAYLEAIMRVYNMYGRRDNIYKARIKILVSSEGVESFRAQVEDEWAKIKGSGVDLPDEEIERIRRYFAPPAFETLPENSASFEAARKADPAFDRWARVNLAAHKAPGYAIVNISLKPYGKPPGDITDAAMEAVADIAERYSFDEIRATHEQNLTLPHVRKDDLYTVYKALDEAGLATANIGLVTDIIACPGLDYCDLANARSIPIAERISERFAAKGGEEDIGELKIKISGCINACGHHHAGHIGILGVDKKGEEFYQITLGGSGAEDASLGEIAGRGLSSEQVVDAVERLVDFYKDNRKGGERFLDAYRRMGHDAFKGVLYADAQA
ncbi:MAG: nitrite/sulfite reductase, partial [Amphiplicatus sp.]